MRGALFVLLIIFCLFVSCQMPVVKNGTDNQDLTFTIQLTPDSNQTTSSRLLFSDAAFVVVSIFQNGTSVAKQQRSINTTDPATFSFSRLKGGHYTVQAQAFDPTISTILYSGSAQFDIGVEFVTPVSLYLTRVSRTNVDLTASGSMSSSVNLYDFSPTMTMALSLPQNCYQVVFPTPQPGVSIYLQNLDGTPVSNSIVSTNIFVPLSPPLSSQILVTYHLSSGTMSYSTPLFSSAALPTFTSLTISPSSYFLTNPAVVLGGQAADHSFTTISSVFYSLDNGATWNGPIGSAGVWSGVPISLPSGDGLKTVLYKATDGNGQSNTSTVNVVLDQTAPPAPSFVLNGGASFINSSGQLYISGNATDPTSGIQSWQNQVLPGTWSGWMSAPGGSFSNYPNPSVGDGTITVNVQVMDNAGNISAVTTHTILLDSTPPALSSFSITSTGPHSGQYAAGESINFSYSCLDADFASIQVTLNGANATTFNSTTATGGGTIAFNTGNTISSSYQFHIVLTDIHGNVAPYNPANYAIYFGP